MFFEICKLCVFKFYEIVKWVYLCFMRSSTGVYYKLLFNFLWDDPILKIFQSIFTVLSDNVEL